MNIQIRQIESSASEALIRGHRVPVDRPVEKGGTDQGPMGGELFLAAVGGCFMSNLLAAIAVRRADVTNCHVGVTATMEGSPPRFTLIELHVSAQCADRELLEKLVEIADRGCIMMNTLRGKLDLRVLIDTRA